MSAGAHSDDPATLAGLYRAWRDLTLAEQVAITEGDWPRTADIQAAKARLQPRIQAATERLEAGAPRSRSKEIGTADEFRPLVAELIQLETINRDLVARQLQQVRAAQVDADKNLRCLRSVRQTYAAAPTACWQSYS